MERRPIRRAGGADAAALTELALRSKAVWGYDAAFMEACRAELNLSADDVLCHPTYLIEGRDGPIGHYQLRLRGDTADVWHVFVAPEAIRTGLGRLLWRHLEQTARAAGATRLEVDPDPHARLLPGDGHDPRRRGPVGQHPRPSPAAPLQDPATDRLITSIAGNQHSEARHAQAVHAGHCRRPVLALQPRRRGSGERPLAVRLRPGRGDA